MANLRRALVFCCFLVLLGFVFIPTSSKSRTSLHSARLNETHSDSTSSNASPEHASYLWVVASASAPSARLCKTLVSSAILGYPEVHLVDWQRTVGRSDVPSHGHEVSKIEGISTFLEAVASSRGGGLSSVQSGAEDDLVLVIDAYDLWFQLPPAVLIQRYHGINRAANRRLKARYGGDKIAPIKPHINQSIIFSAQSKCWSHAEMASNPHCSALPESPFSPDLHAPRYLNSGSAIGRLGDMRSLFERALEKSNAFREADSVNPSDQGIFAEILGEQEVWREWARQTHSLTGRRSILGDRKLEAGSIVSAIEQDSTNFEFGIGLDYGQELFVPTAFSEGNASFVIHNEGIHKVSQEGDIFSPRLSVLDSDIATLQNPWILDDQARRTIDSVNATFPDWKSRNQSWEDVALYTNLDTSVVPVGLHYGSRRGAPKEDSLTLWSKAWYAPYARALLAGHMVSPMKPLATFLPVGNDAEDTSAAKSVYWPPSPYSEARCSRRFDPHRISIGFEDLSWDDVCQMGEVDWPDEVFRDGRGPWKSPKR